jgi:hypothetical protein
MRHIHHCLRCGAGISGAKKYCSPCADVRKVEVKKKYNAKRPRPPEVEGIRYVGTRRGMLPVRTR